MKKVLLVIISSKDFMDATRKEQQARDEIKHLEKELCLRFFYKNFHSDRLDRIMREGRESDLYVLFLDEEVEISVVILKHYIKDSRKKENMSKPNFFSSKIKTKGVELFELKNLIAFPAFAESANFIRALS